MKKKRPVIKTVKKPKKKSVRVQKGKSTHRKSKTKKNGRGK